MRSRNKLADQPWPAARRNEHWKSKRNVAPTWRTPRSQSWAPLSRRGDRKPTGARRQPDNATRRNRPASGARAGMQAQTFAQFMQSQLRPRSAILGARSHARRSVPPRARAQANDALTITSPAGRSREAGRALAIDGRPQPTRPPAGASAHWWRHGGVAAKRALSTMGANARRAADETHVRALVAGRLLELETKRSRLAHCRGALASLSQRWPEPTLATCSLLTVSQDGACHESNRCIVTPPPTKLVPQRSLSEPMQRPHQT
jgi:hypothetical protein